MGGVAHALPAFTLPPLTGDSAAPSPIIEQLHKEAVKEQKRLARIAHLKHLAHLEAVRQHLIKKLANAPLKPNGFAWGNCTYLVAGLLNIPWTGNANVWDDGARALGYKVDSQPKTGAIAQTDGGWAGHVALVLDYTKTKVLLREMNFYGLNVDRERWALRSEFENYIHL